MGRDAFDGAGDLQSRHGFDLHLDLLPNLEPSHVRLVDVSVDHHFIQVGDGQHFGAAVEPAGTGDSLSDRNGPRQHRAIEWSQDFRLGQLVVEQLQRLFRPVEGVAGQFILRSCVVEQLLRNEFVRVELLGALVIPFRFLQLQFRRFNLDQF